MSSDPGLLTRVENGAGRRARRRSETADWQDHDNSLCRDATGSAGVRVAGTVMRRVSRRSSQMTSGPTHEAQAAGDVAICHERPLELRSGGIVSGNGGSGERRQRRGGQCDGRGSDLGRGEQKARSGESSLGGRVATRALIAVGTYVAQDLRDAEGLTRPMLRRAAIRLALCRVEPARQLGHVYLRLDPPAPGALPQVEVIDAASASSPRPATTNEPGACARLTSGDATI
jgi:hypothetical protein